jgi:hypothetical protein
MAEKDWYDELTKKYEFTVVQQPHQGQPEPIAARYLIDEAARLKTYLTDEIDRLKADGWRPLTDTITAETTAIVLVREKRGRAN